MGLPIDEVRTASLRDMELRYMVEILGAEPHAGAAMASDSVTKHDQPLFTCAWGI